MAQNIGRWGLRVPDGTDGPPDVPLWLNRLATDLSDVAKDNQGTLASRPTSTPLSPGIAGRYYRTSEDGVLWRDFGTGWEAVGATLPGSGIVLGGDTNLYRSGTDTLRTDNKLQVEGSGSTAGALNLPNLTGVASGIQFGPDANLYRSAVDTVKTDDNLEAASVTAGGLPASVGVENLRTIRGTFDGAGTILVGSGFTVTKPGTGIYDVAFSTAFAGVPSVVATPARGSVPSKHAVKNEAVGGVTIAGMTETGGGSDSAFSFTAEGPR